LAVINHNSRQFLSLKFVTFYKSDFLFEYVRILFNYLWASLIKSAISPHTCNQMVTAEFIEKKGGFYAE